MVEAGKFMGESIPSGVWPKIDISGFGPKSQNTVELAQNAVERARERDLPASLQRRYPASYNRFYGVGKFGGGGSGD
jgi:hypothetical protein